MLSSSHNLSFGITINESTLPRSSSIPTFAFSILFFFSYSHGFVTTATVKIPISFASSAITGDAPVPVPPPIPAVMNNMSQFSMASLILSLSSIAACFPMSGLAPAPRPFVMLYPILHLRFSLTGLFFRS